jgi:hypothetical protein
MPAVEILYIGLILAAVMIFASALIYVSTLERGD